MADEEVNIRINETRQGNALADEAARIEQLKAKVAELNRLSDFRSKNGDQVGAKFASQDAAKAQKELNAAMRENVSIQREVTNEQRQQESVMKAQKAHMMRAGGALIGAAGASVVENYFAREQIGIRDQMARGEFAHTRSLRGERGDSAGEATGDVRALQDAIFAGEQKRGLLNSQRTQGALRGAAIGAAGGFFAGGGPTPIGIGAAVIGAGIGAYDGYTRGNNAAGENEKEIARNKEELEKRRAEQKARVTAETATSIAATEKLNRGDAQGSRLLQDQVTWLKTKNAILKETGNATLAEQGANAEITRIQKERAGNFAGLINARSGAAESARIASFAAQYSQSGPRDSATGALLNAVNKNHGEAMNAGTRHTFSRPALL